MVYPPRPQLQPLPQFAGTARDGTIPTRALQNELEAFVVASYREGRSLREIAELVDRTQTAVRRVLDRHGIPRRPVGAQPVGDLHSAMPTVLEPATDLPLPGGVLRQLRNAAAVRRAARIRVADVVAETEAADPNLDDRRRAFDTTARWVQLIKLAAAGGRPVAAIARAAGVAPSSIHYRLRTAPESTNQNPARDAPMMDGEVLAEPETGSGSTP